MITCGLKLRIGTSDESCISIASSIPQPNIYSLLIARVGWEGNASASVHPQGTYMTTVRAALFNGCESVIFSREKHCYVLTS